MEAILEFAKNNYIICTIITIILILALIGYLVDKSVNRDVKIKGSKMESVDVSTEEKIDSI